uniref:Uncharacterized protein n=1 Tax=Cannabis sativa TaxID=3483 RepID=A0A803Q9V2_CANSA
MRLCLGEKALPEAISDKDKKEILAKAHSAIILNLGDKVLRKITKETTATRIWLKLEGLYMTNLWVKFRIRKKRTKRTLDYIHNDLWRPSTTVSHSGWRFRSPLKLTGFFTFISKSLDFRA